MEEYVKIGYIAVSEVVTQTVETESGKSILHPFKATSEFKANKGCLIVGRMHSGDENGSSFYMTGKPEVILEDETNQPKVAKDIIVTLGDSVLTNTQDQSSSKFVCEPPYVFTGRIHSGDENGPTSFYQALLGFNSDQYLIKEETVRPTVSVNEDEGTWAYIKDYKGYYLPMTTVQHAGDEKDKSTYSFSIYSVYKKK